MQVVLTPNDGRRALYAYGYNAADVTRRRPIARIIKLEDGTFRAEGLCTMPVTYATGTLAECYDALQICQPANDQHNRPWD